MTRSQLRDSSTDQLHAKLNHLMDECARLDREKAALADQVNLLLQELARRNPQPAEAASNG
jgi:hypothetical protein